MTCTMFIQFVSKMGKYSALIGVAQLVGCGPAKGKGSVPGWGTCETQLIDVSLSHRCFSPSLSPSLPLFLKIKNKIIIHLKWICFILLFSFLLNEFGTLLKKVLPLSQYYLK